MLPCINKQLFGFNCLGCGFQRSILFLLKGQFTVAFKMYPAIYLIILTFAFLVAHQFYKIKYAHKVIRYLVIVIFLTMLVQYSFKTNLFT